MVRTCLDAAQADTDRDLEVIDARSLAPLDMPTIIESVGRTGRLIVVHEAPVRRRRRRRDRGRGHAGVLLPARGPGAAGRRVPRALPAVADRGDLPARPRPHP